MKKYFNVITAATRTNGIGYKGKLPWKSIPGDMQHFKKFTMWNNKKTNKRNAVIMGKATWESLPNNYKPLKSRLNIVLSHTNETAVSSDVKVANSFQNALEIAQRDSSIDEIFVIGGADTYTQALTSFKDQCKSIFLTRIWKDYKCDRFFPKFSNEGFSLAYISKTFLANENGPVPFDFTFYSNSKLSKSGVSCIDPLMLEVYPKHEELQYLELVKKISSIGDEKHDRTGTGTISLFGTMMRFDLSQSFPLLTTKSVYWKGVVEELLWFLRGETNSNKLSKKGVKIWDGNGSREFLDKVGLKHREVGDLGPVYGFQWRHFGADYETMDSNYDGKGVDQLLEVYNKIKNTPDDRRIIMTAWNPAALKQMALPPCHMFCQFYVANNALSCSMYQRSADIGLGVPFNIASYSLLTHILANAAGLNVGEFVHVMGDTHVYNNHLEPLKEQVNRPPNPFPVLNIKKKIDGIKGIESLTLDDFELLEYVPHPKIKMDLSC